MKLKGLAGQNSKYLINTQVKPDKSTGHREKLNPPLRAPVKTSQEPDRKYPISKQLVDDIGPGQLLTDLLALDEKVKSMMLKSQHLIPVSKTDANGTPYQRKAMICKVCQKEGEFTLIRNHIEANHLEGIVIQCYYCDKEFSSRNNLAQHKSRDHKNLK